VPALTWQDDGDGAGLRRETLARGHQVTALVLHPEKLEAHPQLTAVKVDVQDTPRWHNSSRKLADQPLTIAKRQAKGAAVSQSRHRNGQLPNDFL
jgi:putative NADH-flavin reductase